MQQFKLAMLTAKSRFSVVFVALALLAAIACTPEEVALMEGILQDVDTVDGEITIVTKDGRTVNLKIDSQAPVSAEGTTSTLEALVPGTNVQVDVDDNRQVVREVKARLAKVEGRISAIDGDKVTVETESGREVTVTVGERTRIELEDDVPGALADLKVGMEAEIRFDPENDTALKIETEEDEIKVKGAIVEIAGGEVTIETPSGRRIAVVVPEQARIKLDDDFLGKVEDLRPGMQAEARIDPFTRRAVEIEVELEEAEIEGPIVSIEGQEVTIASKGGRERTVTVNDRTSIEMDDDFPGRLEDLEEGLEVEVKFDPTTNVALKVKID